MPILDSKQFITAMTPVRQMQVAERAVVGLQLSEKENRTAIENIPGAAFRQENLIGAFIARSGLQERNDPVEDYSPYIDDKAILEEYPAFLDNFIDSRSPQETRMIAEKINRELEDREIIAAHPVLGSLAAFSAGVLSPENLIPGFAAVRGAKMGKLVLQTAARTAATGAISTGIAEFGMQSLQETRTAEESIRNITGATLLSGFFGAGAAAYTGGKKIAVEKFMERILNNPESIGKLNNDLDEIALLESRISAGASDDIAALNSKRKAFLSEFPEANELFFKYKFMDRFVRPVFRISVNGQMAASPSAFVRDIGDRLLSNKFVRKTAFGGETSVISVEARSDTLHKGLFGSAFVNSDSIYRAAKKNGSTKLGVIEFNNEVGRALRNGDEALETSIDGVPLSTGDRQAINASAKAWRRSSDILLNEMKRLGMVSESDMDLLGTDVSWFHRSYDLDKIAGDTEGFVNAVSNDLLEQGRVTSIEQGRAKAYQFVNKMLNEEDFSGAAHGTYRPSSLRQRELLVRSRAVENYLVNDPRRVLDHTFRQLSRHTELTREFLKPQKASVNEIRNELSAFKKALLKAGGREATAARINELVDSINNAKALNALEGSARAERLEELMLESESLRREIKAIGGKEVSEARDMLSDVRREIMNIRNEAKESDAELGAFVEEMTGQKHTLQEIIEKSSQLEKEMDDLFKKRYMDSISLKAEKREVTEDYERMIREESDPKKKADLRERMARDIASIDTARDRILGIAGMPKNPSSLGFRFARALRNINTARFGGNFGLTSLADASTGVFNNGLKSSAKAFAAIVSDTERAIASIPEAARMDGILEQALVSMRTAELSLINDGAFSIRQNRFEKALALGANLSLRASLLMPWTRAMKNMASLSITDNILSLSLKVASGKATAKDLQRLATSGISESLAKKFAKEQDKFFSLKGGALATDIGEWANKEAAKQFEQVVLKEVEFSVVTPGLGDMPQIADTAMGKLLFQFRSFSLAATNRILLPGLQTMDARFLSGIMASTAAGAMSYALQQVAMGQPISTDPGTVLVNAIDRSGWTGILNDVDRVLEVGTSGRFSLARLSDERTTRLQHVGLAGLIGGVTVGTAEDMLKIMTSFSKEGEFTQGDINRIRRFVWFQNHFAVRRLFDQAAAKAGSELRAPDKSGFRTKVKRREFIEFK